MAIPKKIVISGAGLVGSLAAIGFKKKGYDVHLFEARSDIRESKILAGKSINLILTRKGIEPLKRLGILEEVLKITKPVFGRMMHSLSGDLTYQPYGKDKTEKNYSVSRSELNKKLITIASKLGVQTYFDSALENINFKEKTASFKNQDIITYDLFVGSDGAGSRARSELVRELPELVSVKTTPLGAGYKELFMPANVDGSFKMKDSALHIWPRGKHFLMALPNLDGSFTMTVYMPDDWFKEFNTKEKVENYFKENYPDSLELMPDYLEDFLGNPSGFLGSLDLNKWTFEDQFVLVGDAAHAICPFFGQGMNCGFSDIEYLLNQLEQESDWKLILENYQAHQKPNGDAIRDMSLENFVEMSEKVGDKNFLLRKQVESALEKEYPELFRSRYAQVVYTLTPYHKAYENGKKQDLILDKLCENLSSIEELDLKVAREIIFQF